MVSFREDAIEDERAASPSVDGRIRRPRSSRRCWPPSAPDRLPSCSSRSRPTTGSSGRSTCRRRWPAKPSSAAISPTRCAATGPRRNACPFSAPAAGRITFQPLSTRSSAGLDSTPVWGSPQSDHGRNQAWFEFNSELGELLGMEVVQLPVYSWGCAAGHAIRMASRLTGRGIDRQLDHLHAEELAKLGVGARTTPGCDHHQTGRAPDGGEELCPADDLVDNGWNVMQPAARARKDRHSAAVRLRRSVSARWQLVFAGQRGRRSSGRSSRWSAGICSDTRRWIRAPMAASIACGSRRCESGHRRGLRLIWPLQSHPPETTPCRPAKPSKLGATVPNLGAVGLRYHGRL